MLAIAFAGAAFFQTFSSMIFVFFSFAGVGWAFINVNSFPMVVEMCTGSDVGKFTGYYYLCSMSAQVVTPILSGWVMENMGYSYLLPYSCFFVVASFVTMLLVKHGDSKPIPKQSQLEVFDAGDD